jgi:perosamine synthetase
MTTIPIAGPSITQKEIDYVAEAVGSAWYTRAGEYHTRFESAFAKYVGVRHAVALPSCTSAIHLSLAALGVGPGDEVIVPDLTWIATSAPISYVGATPVFADTDPRTWCLDAGAFEACITSKTRAVIPVDLYGGMPDMHAIRRIANAHQIAVIEDAAEAVGSKYRGRPAGALGDVGVFSFHGSKTLTTGEGGMLVTDRDDLFSRVLFLRDHGRPPGDRKFYNTEIAFKYKMSAMQAALGLAQLERIHELIAVKRAVFSWYREELSEVPGITLNHEPQDVFNSYWMATVILDEAYNLESTRVIERLRSMSIDTRPFFFPLSQLPAYENTVEAQRARQRNRVSYSISPRGINLPSALKLSRDDVKTVCAALKGIIAEHA